MTDRVEDISVTIDEDKSVDITLQATDVDNDNLSYSIVNDASNGTTTLNDNTLTTNQMQIGMERIH